MQDATCHMLAQPAPCFPRTFLSIVVERAEAALWRVRTQDSAEQHEEDEEQPHAEAQADQVRVVLRDSGRTRSTQCKTSWRQNAPPFCCSLLG